MNGFGSVGGSNAAFQVIKWQWGIYVKCERWMTEIVSWKSVLPQTWVNGIRQGWLTTFVSPFNIWWYQGLTNSTPSSISSGSLEILQQTGLLLVLPGVSEFPGVCMQIRSLPSSSLYCGTISFLLSFESHQTLSAKDLHHSNEPDDCQCF